MAEQRTKAGITRDESADARARVLARTVGTMIDLQRFTYKDIEDCTGFASNTVRRYVNAFHSEGLVHMDGFAEDERGRLSARAFRWGKGKDVKRVLNRGTVKQRLRGLRSRTAKRIRKDVANSVFDLGRKIT